MLSIKLLIDGIELAPELISFGQEILVEFDRHRLKPVVFLQNLPIVAVQVGLCLCPTLSV
jgi:hypothetical protein